MRALLLALTLSATLPAHDPGLSSSSWRLDADRVRVEVSMNNQDAAAAVGVDRNADGVVDAAELDAGRTTVFAYFAEQVEHGL